MNASTNQLSRIREAMSLQGMSQKRIAQAMGLPQSAISNLLLGKRQLKVDELRKLESILGIVYSKGNGLVPIPLIQSNELLDFEKAVSNTSSIFPRLYKGAESRLFAFIEFEPRLSNERMRHIYCIIDPDDRELHKNGVYLVAEGGGYMLAEYKDEPARVQSMWDPSWEPGPRLVGSFPFTVLGAIRQFGWNPDLEIRKAD